MATRKMSSVKGRVARFTRLDECGVPVIGTCSSIVTAGFIRVTYGREVEAGDDYTQKNAWGDFCVNEKDPDKLKWITVSIELCEIDPGLMDMVGGMTPVVVGTDTIGETEGPNANVGRFAIEVWTKKAGIDACAGGIPEWGYFVVPNVANGKLDSDLVIENAVMNVTLAGEGYGAPTAWGVTPYGDNPFRRTGGFPVGEMRGRVVTNVQPPAPTDGCVELANRALIGAGDVFPANTAVTAQNATVAGTLTGLGYTSTGPAWATGEFFSIGPYQFNWTGTTWAAGAHA